MDFDVDKYVIKYNTVPREELQKIRDYCPSKLFFKFIAEHLHQQRENEKTNGKAALRTRPLVHVLSVSVQPKNDKPLAIYGRIHAEFSSEAGGMAVHELYNRARNVAEILGSATTLLTLNGPDYSCYPHENAYIPLFGSRINLLLFDGADNVFARKCFSFDDTDVEDGYEKVKFKSILCQQGSITLRYVAIPFGVNSRIQVMLHNRNVSSSKKRDFINVFGKITVRYDNTYGNYSSEESVLFEKQDHDFERVEIDNNNTLRLSRCWVALPAYSPLVVTVDLSEFETRQNILNQTTQLLPKQGWGSSDSFVSDDFFIRVHVWWFTPKPLGLCDYHYSPSLRGIPTEQIEEMDTEGEIPTEDMDAEGDDESSDEESDEPMSSNIKSSWSLRPHKSKLWPSPAVEIFSVFIGHEKSKAVQVYGSIEVLSDECGLCYIFRRDENDALGLSEHMKSAPILDGSRVFEHFISLQMKFDIKDVEGRLAIKGYVDWDASVLDSNKFHEKQLCSFIQGQNGFAAVHYSIFSEAVAANIKVFLNLKTEYADVYPEVCGSLIAHYSCYDYSSKYNKDHYQMVLFRRTQDESIKPSVDWAIPLSRSMVVVPLYSSLIFDIDLSFGVSHQKCVGEVEIEVGIGRKTIETDDFVFRIELDWCEIK
ncbi:hypothetical protein ACHQM5_029356 [Ranunculus cassubicifolius]